ncbi:anti-sigma factor family protein [Mesorhizobium sp. 1B3]|uniref:anti-sigma factor family protein n=1 Tax=Mesorhizobium sp. 1B3 TaxID=3243599 RepID=UPI003D978E8E
MTEARDPIVDTDLDAYVDDQLAPSRRIEVEAYLSARPDLAARVMADLRARDELRLAMVSAEATPKPATSAAARRLSRGLASRRHGRLLQRAASIGILVCAGWLAHAAIGPVTEVVASTPPPAFVGDALRAHNTTLVRASMASQPETAAYDEAEIRAATGIVMPNLPGGWKVLDAQIYPSQFGPSVELALESRELGMMSLFAVRPGNFNVVDVTVDSSAENTAAYWQIGEVAYALIGKADSRELDRAADRLADTLY